MTQSTTEFVDRIDADQADPGPARISGGHLVAKALKAEGVDTIFTLCGGHIYDGCVDEGTRWSTSATSRSQHTPPTVTPGSAANLGVRW